LLENLKKISHGSENLHAKMPQAEN